MGRTSGDRALDRRAAVVEPSITVSSRDLTGLGARLEDWLCRLLPLDAEPRVTHVVQPEGSGMSSDTVLFTLEHRVRGRAATHHMVARIAPGRTDVPVFPDASLATQFRVMRAVRRCSAVPVPEVLWLEEDPAVLGAPFLLLARVEGRIPRDVLPYTFGFNWVDDATIEQRDRMERSAVRTLAAIHALSPDDHDLSFLEVDAPGATRLERHLAHWDRYRAMVVGSIGSPLLDEGFAWLRANLPDPASLGEDRLSWGDARLGNLVFANHEVVGVLDWELAGLAPIEVDLGWMAYLHLFFQDLAVDLGLRGLPEFMRPQRLADLYAEATGHTPADLTWFLVYAAVRHGAVMRRVTERAVHFGEADVPRDPDDMILHRRQLRRMLDGTYWR